MLSNATLKNSCNVLKKTQIFSYWKLTMPLDYYLKENLAHNILWETIKVYSQIMEEWMGKTEKIKRIGNTWYREQRTRQTKSSSPRPLLDLGVTAPSNNKPTWNPVPVPVTVTVLVAHAPTHPRTHANSHHMHQFTQVLVWVTHSNLHNSHLLNFCASSILHVLFNAHFLTAVISLVTFSSSFCLQRDLKFSHLLFICILNTCTLIFLKSCLIRSLRLDKTFSHQFSDEQFKNKILLNAKWDLLTSRLCGLPFVTRVVVYLGLIVLFIRTSPHFNWFIYGLPRANLSCYYYHIPTCTQIFN